MIRLCVVALALPLLAGCSMTAAEMAGLTQSLNESSSSFNAGAQQRLNSTSMYQAPQPITPYSSGGNTIRCINAGIYTNCRY